MNFSSLRQAIYRALPLCPPICDAASLILGARMLRREGWFRSRRTQRAMGLDGAPLPWFTYPAIDLLSSKDFSKMRIFEYGGGQSSLWWAARAREVVTCEHDPGFAKHLEQALPSNATLAFRPLSAPEAYVECPVAFPPLFDGLVVDGRLRSECLRNAHRFTNPSGFLILDNSDRVEYHSALSELESSGFRRLDLWGFGPGNSYKWCTTILYRDQNLLGI